MSSTKETIQKLLETADIKINADRPWDIKVNDERFYGRVLTGGSLGLGESYMDGWWDCESVDEFFFHILKTELSKKIQFNLSLILNFLRYRIFNLQNKNRASEVAEHHYNLGNKLYSSFLDPYYQYSCGYFQETKELNRAQEQKLDLICRKLQLKSGDRVLDIGCGWGGLARYMAEHYKCSVVGINLSDEQIKFAREFNKGFPVEILKMDYRDLEDKFDKIVSVGMFEHVGVKNYRKFFKIIKKCLKDDGLCLLHTIGSNHSVMSPDAWITKYIFPNGFLPSVVQIGKGINRILVLEDWHSFGQYYDETLVAWFKNFNDSWTLLRSDYNQRFYRMWTYYLLSCAGAFRARKIQLWQIVLSKDGIVGGYKSVR